MNKIVEVLVTIIEYINNLLLGKYDTADRLHGNIQTLKDGAMEYPGHMAFASKGGEYFHGCRASHFKTIDELNRFFLPGNPGHLKLVCELIPQKDGSVVAVYTNVVSEEDKEDIADFSRSQNEFLRAKKEERRMARIAEIEAKENEIRENLRLAEVGRKHEANCKKDK